MSTIILTYRSLFGGDFAKYKQLMYKCNIYIYMYKYIYIYIVIIIIIITYKPYYGNFDPTINPH